MFVEGRAVSHAAGEFATRYLFSEDFMTKARQSKVPKGALYPTSFVSTLSLLLIHISSYFLILFNTVVFHRAQETDGHSDHAH